MPKRNGGTNTTLEKFTGKERDTEGNLNLDYFGARYYDPAINRWLSSDPLASKYPSLSPYNYVANNPVNAFDPDGAYIVSVHYKITLDAMKSLGYNTNRSDLVAHYSSVYADNPGRFYLTMNNLATNLPGMGGYPSVSYRSGIDYSGTRNSQNTNSMINSRRHSMMADYEFNEGLISQEEAMERGLSFGWNKIFESARAGKLSEQGENSKGMQALGVGLHALQDAYAHQGTHMGGHSIKNDIYGVTLEAKSITRSALIVRQVLDGDFSNIKHGQKLNLRGMSAEQKEDVLNRIMNYLKDN